LDSFEGDKTLTDKIGAFFVHLVPTFLLILLLILSWKREWIGAIAFLLLGISYIIMAWEKFPLSTYFIISGPLVLISILFAWGWILKRNVKQN